MSDEAITETPSSKINGLNHQIKWVLNKVVSESKFSREEILERVNELAKESGVSLCKGVGPLSKETFFKWLNPNELFYKPGLEALIILYYVLDQNMDILAPISHAAGLSLFGSREIYYRDLGLVHYQLKELNKKLEILEAVK